MDFGKFEFRLNSNLVKRINLNQELQLTVDYLANRNEFSYLTGSHLVWDNQYAFGMGYRFLYPAPWLKQVAFSAFSVNSNNTELPPVAIGQQNSQQIVHRLIKGAEGAGGSVGVVLEPCSPTHISVDLLYETLNYQDHLRSPKKNLGYSLALEQALPLCLACQLAVTSSPFFNRYASELRWQIPVHTCPQMELSLRSQYITGDLPEPKDFRISLMLSLYWPCPSNLPIQEKTELIKKLLAEAVKRPLIRMPQTFNASESRISQVIYPS